MISEVGIPAVTSSISSLTKSGDIARHSTYGTDRTQAYGVSSSSQIW